MADQVSKYSNDEIELIVRGLAMLEASLRRRANDRTLSSQAQRIFAADAEVVVTLSRKVQLTK